MNARSYILYEAEKQQNCLALHLISYKDYTLFIKTIFKHYKMSYKFFIVSLNGRKYGVHRGVNCKFSIDILIPYNMVELKYEKRKVA